ncbi:hypothetical protein LC55x_4823 [Lysobacter capsici]|nr:hypothetical protein LC55x_4823 [Lysobacter capsici]
MASRERRRCGWIAAAARGGSSGRGQKPPTPSLRFGANVRAIRDIGNADRTARREYLIGHPR